MGIEYIILFALFFIFLMSYCSYLRKIRQRQTYENERNVRIRRQNNAHANVRPQSEIFVNNAFLIDTTNWDNSRETVTATDSGGINPSAPPPYGFQYSDLPPKYEDLFKEQPEQTNRTAT